MIIQYLIYRNNSQNPMSRINRKLYFNYDDDNTMFSDYSDWLMAVNGCHFCGNKIDLEKNLSVRKYNIY